MKASSPPTKVVPVLDVLIVRDGNAWRVYGAPGSWLPGMGAPIDPCEGTIVIGRPDLGHLQRCMRKLRLPFEYHMARTGAVEIGAKGRAAVALAEWLRRVTNARRIAPVSRT